MLHLADKNGGGHAMERKLRCSQCWVIMLKGPARTDMLCRAKQGEKGAQVWTGVYRDGLSSSCVLGETVQFIKSAIRVIVQQHCVLLRIVGTKSVGMCWDLFQQFKAWDFM